MIAEKGAENNERLNSGAVVENVKHRNGLQQIPLYTGVVSRGGMSPGGLELTASVNWFFLLTLLS